MSWQPDRKTSATPPSRTTATDQNLAQPASRHHAVGDRPTNENNEPCCKQLKQRLCSLSCGRLWKSTRVDRTEVKAKDYSFSFPSRPLQEFGQSDSVDIQVFHTRPAVQVTIFRFVEWWGTATSFKAPKPLRYDLPLPTQNLRVHGLRGCTWAPKKGTQRP